MARPTEIEDWLALCVNISEYTNNITNKTAFEILMSVMLDKFNVGYVSDLDEEEGIFRPVNSSNINIGDFIIRTVTNNSGEIEVDEKFNFTLLNISVYNKYDDNIDEHFCATEPPKIRPSMYEANEFGWVGASDA